MISDQTKLEEVERQLRWRVDQYPERIERKWITRSNAEWNIRVWESIVTDYRNRVVLAGAQAAIEAAREADQERDNDETESTADN